MLFPLIGARLHGWLDELVVLVYLGGAAALGLEGSALAIAIGGAIVHFLLTRLTDYPQGRLQRGTVTRSLGRSRLRIIPFRIHAFVELGEGLAVIAATIVLAGGHPFWHRVFLGLMGAAQLGAFAFSDYGPAPEGLRP